MWTVATASVLTLTWWACRVEQRRDPLADGVIVQAGAGPTLGVAAVPLVEDVVRSGACE